MKKLVLVISIVVVSMFMSGCTDNMRAKVCGGISTVQLDRGKKLLNVTWKNNDLWVLTRSMTPQDTVEVYELTEKSNFGVFQGKVIFVENK